MIVYYIISYHSIIHNAYIIYGITGVVFLRRVPTDARDGFLAGFANITITIIIVIIMLIIYIYIYIYIYRERERYRYTNK